MQLLYITYVYLFSEDIKKCIIITKIRPEATTRGRKTCSQSRRMTQELQPNCFSDVLFHKPGGMFIIY